MCPVSVCTNFRRGSLLIGICFAHSNGVGTQPPLNDSHLYNNNFNFESSVSNDQMKAYLDVSSLNYPKHFKRNGIRLGSRDIQVKCIFDSCHVHVLFHVHVLLTCNLIDRDVGWQRVCARGATRL